MANVIDCGNCRFWEEEADNPGWGICRAKAPSPAVRPDGGGMVGPFSHRAIWPYTRAEDGCGEAMVRRSARKSAADQTVTDGLSRNPFDASIRKAREGQRG